MTENTEHCFVIAEAGVNHNGAPDRALALVDAAAETGADAVKFQHFDPARLARADADMADYQVENIGEQKSQRQMLADLVLPVDALAAAAQRAAERGIVFLCTAFDGKSAAEIADLVPAWKVSSTDLTNFPFLEELCAFAKPLILSSGMATMEEVEEAVAFAAPRARAGSGTCFAPVSLLHCVSAYPAPVDQTNLSVLPLLAERLGVPVGYSDHSLGIGSAIAAAALGAVIIEKHITTDQTLPGPDHKASLEPAEFASMVAAIRDAAAARGRPVKEPQPCEMEHRTSVRRSLHSTRDLARDHVLERDDLIALRPADGIPPGDMARIIGCKLARAVAAGTPLHEEDIAP